MLLLLSSGWGGLCGGKLAALCLPGRYGLQLEGRHLLGTPFGCSLGSYRLHRGGVRAGCRHLHGGTRPTVETLASLRMSLVLAYVLVHVPAYVMAYV